MPHISFTKILDRMADNDWGRDFKDMEAAEQEMSKDDSQLLTYAAMALLKHLRTACREIAYSEVDDDGRIEKGSDFSVFPGTKVGDRLYRGSISNGFYEYVVVGVDEDGACVVSRTGLTDGNYAKPFYADETMCVSPRDAITATAGTNIEVLEKRVRFLREALEAAESGADLTPYMNGTP